MIGVNLVSAGKSKVGLIKKFKILTANSNSRVITARPDGNLWFTEYEGNKIGRITTSGIITEFPVGIANNYIGRITTNVIIA